MTATEAWALQSVLASRDVQVLTAHQLRLVADYHARRWVGFACIHGASSERAASAQRDLEAVLGEFQRRSVDLDPWIPGLEA